MPSRNRPRRPLATSRRLVNAAAFESLEDRRMMAAELARVSCSESRSARALALSRPSRV